MKDEDLEQVNGGFDDAGVWNTVVAKFHEEIKPRVRVRHTDGYGKEIIEYGYAINASGIPRFNPNIVFMIDGKSNGVAFNPSNVELVE